ncbi:MFS transporter [Sphingomonas sp. BK235]|uniref:MFS transporter n=1 Tax=Sphingomonas sp. BK235 TaxID=2512131 RepID=UPI00104A71AE|nr:MFS transporter [Sphingomonas sp. BK235]TCP31026.1 benzoate transport [Sphingomonas sp. BK235]
MTDEAEAEAQGSLDHGPMHPLQVFVVALCIALNALDGFDVLSISFAAPGIAADWGVDRAVLGVVLSMELLGMSLGSVLIGNVADRFGRRPTILGCLAVMATGMFAAASAGSVAVLSATRLLTGIGIGGMLSSTSAMVAEFSSTRRRGLTMSLNIAGYSAGVILGGTIASTLLGGSGSWRLVFLLGGTATVVLLPVATLLLPESPASLLERRPPGALERVNALLRRLGRAPLAALPPQPIAAPRPSIASLFAPAYRRATLSLTVAYFAQIMLFYFLQKWLPKIVVDMGHAQAEAGRVLVMANVGTMSGAIAIGLVAQRWPVRPAVIGAMLVGFVLIGMFGMGSDDLTQLGVTAAVAGFFVNAGVVGLYPILAETFPAALRASGTGFVIGIGRGGSALGPVIAGAMFSAGAGLFAVSLAMGAAALLAAAMLVLLRPAGDRSRSAAA